MFPNAPSPALRQLFSELERLFQTETQSRVRSAEKAQAEHLNQFARRLQQADGFAEIAAILCDACAPFCNEGAVFHVNHEVVTGACRRGSRQGNETSFHQIGFAAQQAAAFAAVIESHEPVVAICSAMEISATLFDIFAHAPDDKAHLFPIVVTGSTIGILYASGSVDSPALELLTQCAAMTFASRQKPARAAAPPDVLRIEPAPAIGDPITSPASSLHLRAQQFARVQVAEIHLYRAEAVKAGRAHGDLYSALQEPIDDARQDYEREFFSAEPGMRDYFHEELLHRLAHDKASSLGEKYPGPLV
jgi:hypothetical protein